VQLIKLLFLGKSNLKTAVTVKSLINYLALGFNYWLVKMPKPKATFSTKFCEWLKDLAEDERKNFVKSDKDKAFCNVRFT